MALRSLAVAVYCGSSLGSNQAFADCALSVGRALGSAKRTLVYGGGYSGLMGVAGGAAIQSGGRTVGVFPVQMLGGELEKTKPTKQHEEVLQALRTARERLDLCELVPVNSMHERKVEMAKRVSGFIGLPGGFGTFEELLEVTTWSQIGVHDKPVIVLNVGAFYDPLRQQIKNAIDAGFIHPSTSHLIQFIDEPTDTSKPFDWGEAALAAIDSWVPGQTKPHYDWTKQYDRLEVNALLASALASAST